RPEYFSVEALRVSLSFEQRLLVSICDCCRAGYSRTDCQDYSIGSSQTVGKPSDIRTGTHQTHLPTNHIEKLWKFIELECPHHSARMSDSGIASSCYISIHRCRC